MGKQQLVRSNNVPAPNEGFIAVAAGGAHSLGLKADGSIVAWGANGYGFGSMQRPRAQHRFHRRRRGRGQILGIRLRPGDFDGDGRVDESDYLEFAMRLYGPDADPEADDWRWFDYNDDGRVDMADFRLMQNAFTGP
jgi:alpha-tubulin suppressor-like RCC1 family protein